MDDYYYIVDFNFPVKSDNNFLRTERTFSYETGTLIRWALEEKPERVADLEWRQ